MPSLLDTAKDLGLNVVGVSFHVGSGCNQLESYAAAIANARTVFDIAYSKGMRLSLLDIGGGFPGSGSDTSATVDTIDGQLPIASSSSCQLPLTPSPSSFVDIAGVIRSSLTALFPPSSGVRVIAEPGRYFVEGAFTLCTNIISRRVTAPSAVAHGGGGGGGGDADSVVIGSGGADSVVVGSGGARKFTTLAAPPSPTEHTRYYINDGVYGSCVVYDHAVVRPVPLPSTLLATDASTFRRYLANSTPVDVTTSGPGAAEADRPCRPGEHPSSVWGQTCDGFDVVLPKVNLPRLAIGDWLCFENMGAYTVAAGSTFNGFPKPQCEYLYDDGDDGVAGGVAVPSVAGSSSAGSAAAGR